LIHRSGAAALVLVCLLTANPLPAAALRSLYTPCMGLSYSPTAATTASAYGMGW
jgi:hypothetical protein